MSISMEENGNHSSENVSIRFTLLPVDLVKPWSGQPRKCFDPVYEQQLVDSIHEHGVVEPLIVRSNASDESSFEIVCGHMRRMAAVKTGLDQIPCIIRELSDSEAFELAVIENVARCSLNPVDEALGYKRLIKEGNVYSQQELASRLGVSPARISQMMKIANLPDLVIKEIRNLQKEMFTRVNSHEEPFRISERHLRPLVNLELEQQLEVVRTVFERSLSVARTEELASQILSNLSGAKLTKKKRMNQIVSVLDSSPEGTKVSVSKKEFVIRIQHDQNQDKFLHRFDSITDWLGENELVSAFFASKESDTLPG